MSKCCLSVAIKSKKSQNSLSYCDKAKNLKKLECIESKMECSLDKKGTQVANSRWRQTKLTCYINGCLPMRFLGTLHKVRCMKCQSGYPSNSCSLCFEIYSFCLFPKPLVPGDEKMRGRLYFDWTCLVFRVSQLGPRKCLLWEKVNCVLIHFVLWTFHRSSQSQQTTGWCGGWVGGSALWYGVTLPWKHMNSSWNAHLSEQVFPLAS